MLAEEEKAIKAKLDKAKLRAKLAHLDLPPIKQLLDILGWVAKTKKEGGGAANAKRTSIIEGHASMLVAPPTPLTDAPVWLAWVEEEHLGIALTCSKIDACDTSQVNVTCKEYLGGQSGFLLFGAEVLAAREVKTRKGKSAGSKMAFLTLCDHTCSLEDVVCFPEVWKEYGHLLTENNTVILQGERDDKKDSNTLIVKKVWQASQTGSAAA